MTSIVKLNVGGYKFCTTSDTLKKVQDTYFSPILSGRLSTTKDEEGALFIDRDGQFFAPILTFLRTGEVSIPPNMTKADLLREARYFGVQPLVEELTYVPTPDDPTDEDGEPGCLAANVDSPPDIERYVVDYFGRHETAIVEMIRRLNKEGHMNVSLQIIPGHRQDFERPPQLLGSGINKLALYMNFTTLHITKYTRVQALLAQCFKRKGFSGYFRPGELIELWWSPSEFKRESDIIYF